MERISINGIGVAYELLGPEGAPAIALTPGGRFPMDTPGLHRFGEALAAGGLRVLLWDRPNCGSTDVCFEGDSESELQARTLIGLIRALKLGKTALAAGSAGSRVSLIAASRFPDDVSHLIVWWISGGPISLAQLAAYYTADSASAANLSGMQAVADLPSWADQMARNPGNRAIFLKQDPKQFIQTMQAWALAFAPSADSPVPRMSPADFAKLKMPVLIFRNGESDLSHTRETSDWVHKLIPHSKMIEAPWPDSEWNERSATHEGGLFVTWPKLAPQILEFMGRK